MSKLTVRDVGRLCGVQLPSAPGKAKCPIRKHQRDDKTFRVFVSRSGDEIWKCWSCDEPDNVGDAVALYAHLQKLGRKEAWLKLREMGHEVPGSDRTGTDRRSFVPRVVAPPLAKPKVGVRGVKVERVLPLPQARLETWRALPDDGVREFLESRGFDPSFDFRSFGVIAMPSSCVGFVYVDPMTGSPCRVKVRGTRDKKFWNEPRPDPNQPGAKALAPLWLSDRLKLDVAASEALIITEGELDALALVSLGIPNVVSLPDGSESALTVSLEPLCGIFRTWYVAVDADEPGERAWRHLRDRARASGAEPVRITWARMEGDEVERFKDANDALKAGFTREDFERCLRVSAPSGRRVA